MFTKKNISLALITISFIWIASILAQNRNAITQISENLHPDSLINLILSTIFVCLAIALLVPLFSIIVYQTTQKKLPIQYLAKLFFAGQIVSYLPGRFLGTAYLINETQKIIPALTMLRINIELILTIIIFNVIAAASIISYFQLNQTAALMIFLGGNVLFLIYLRLNFFDSVLHYTSRLLPKKISKKVVQSKTHRPFEYKTILKIIVLFVLHWILYLCAWHYLSRVFIMLDQNIIFLLAATYTISWIVGFITMITPGGLGVREASFVLLSAKYLAQHHASILSLFLRIWLIFTDLLLFLISHIILKIFPCSIEEN